VRWAVDLFRGIPQQDLHPHERQILPAAKLRCLAHDPAPSPALWAAAAALIRLDPQVELPATALEPESGDFHVFEA